jgi:hypothetical protein
MTSDFPNYEFQDPIKDLRYEFTDLNVEARISILGQLLQKAQDPSDQPSGVDKGKAIPVTGREGLKVVRRRGSHISYTIGS